MNGKNTPVSKTLADLLESRGTLTQDQILTLLKPVMTAVTQLHKQNGFTAISARKQLYFMITAACFFAARYQKAIKDCFRQAPQKTG